MNLLYEFSWSLISVLLMRHLCTFSGIWVYNCNLNCSWTSSYIAMSYLMSHYTYYRMHAYAFIEDIIYIRYLQIKAVTDTIPPIWHRRVSVSDRSRVELPAHVTFQDRNTIHTPEIPLRAPSVWSAYARPRFNFMWNLNILLARTLGCFVQQLIKRSIYIIVMIRARSCDTRHRKQNRNEISLATLKICTLTF